MRLLDWKETFDRSVSFINDVFIATKDYLVDFAKGCWQHGESITILSLGAVGLTTLLSELPFVYTLPMWIEAPMVIPVISVLLIIGLVKLAEHRAVKRGTAPAF